MHCCVCNLGNPALGQFCCHDTGIYLCEQHKEVRMVRASEITRLLSYFSRRPPITKRYVK